MIIILLLDAATEFSAPDAGSYCFELRFSPLFSLLIVLY